MLVEKARARDIKISLDIVPNHASDQHPGCLESRKQRRGPKRDWYIWRDPNLAGRPHNNWLSNFGGSAWQFDPLGTQCSYHAFLREQPDLNWRNPHVGNAIYDAMRFWLERCVDGFRVAVIWQLIKDAGAPAERPAFKPSC